MENLEQTCLGEKADLVLPRAEEVGAVVRSTKFLSEVTEVLQSQLY